MEQEQSKITIEELKKDPPAIPIAPPLAKSQPVTGWGPQASHLQTLPWRHASWCDKSGRNCDRAYCRPYSSATEAAADGVSILPHAHPGIKHKGYIAHQESGGLVKIIRCKLEGCKWEVRTYDSEIKKSYSEVLDIKEPQGSQGDSEEIEFAEFLRTLISDMSRAGSAAEHTRRQALYWWAGEIGRRAKRAGFLPGGIIDTNTNETLSVP